MIGTVLDQEQADRKRLGACHVVLEWWEGVHPPAPRVIGWFDVTEARITEQFERKCPGPSRFRRNDLDPQTVEEASRRALSFLGFNAEYQLV